MRAGWFWSLVVLMLGGMVATAWVTAAGIPDGLTDLDPVPVRTDVEVVATDVNFDATATVAAKFTAGVPLLASGLSGVVTEVLVATGDEVTVGDPLYRVGGVMVHAYDGPLLYRPLERSAKGPDVVAAQALLAKLLPDEDVPQSGTMDNATVRAVTKYASSIGAGSNVRVLDPAWFVHLPTTPYPVATMEVTVAAPAPAAGMNVATTQSMPSELVVHSDSAGPDGAYLLVSSGNTYPLTRVGGEWSIDDPDGIADALRSSTQIEDGSMPRQADAPQLTGRTRLANPEPGVAVPGAALLTGDAGQVCVVLSEGTTPVEVTVVGSTIEGAAQLKPTLEPGTMVLIDPLATSPDLTCP